MAKQSRPRTEEDVLGPLMLRLIGTTAALMVPLLWFGPGAAVLLALTGHVALLPVWAVLGHHAGVARRLFILFVVALSLIVVSERLLREMPSPTPSATVLVGLYFLVLLPVVLRILGYACSRGSHDSAPMQQKLQLSIRQILGLTTLTAVTIVVAQGEAAQTYWRGRDAWLFTLLFPGIAAWLVLGIWPFASISLLLVILGLVISFGVNSYAVPWAVCYAISVVVPLFVFRSVGFRLARIKTPPARIKPKQSIAAIDSYFTEHDHP